MIKEYTFNIEHKSTPVTLKYTEKEYEKLTQEEKDNFIKYLYKNS